MALSAAVKEQQAETRVMVHTTGIADMPCFVIDGKEIHGKTRQLD